MKKIRIFLLLILLAIVLASLNVNSALVLNKTGNLTNAYKNNSLVRLHVIANSNSPKDQYLKRRVRDSVINYVASYSQQNYLISNPVQVEQYVNRLIKQEGVNYSAKVSFGKYYFPKRTYNQLTLPAGDYKALKIILGNGQGANWWCVLLPPLCVEKEVAANNKLKVKFKITELLDKKVIKSFSYKLFPFLNKKTDKIDQNNQVVNIKQKMQEIAKQGILFID